MSTVRVHPLIVSLLISASLAACGGGGDREPTATSPAAATPSGGSPVTPLPASDPTTGPPPVAQTPVVESASAEPTPIGPVGGPPSTVAPVVGEPAAGSADSPRVPGGVAVGDVLPATDPPPVAQTPVVVPPVAVAAPAVDDAEAEPADSGHFPSGVAAGDVNWHSVVLWARGAASGPITFEYGRDKTRLGRPEGVVHRHVDDPNVPVKAVVSGLQAGTQYYYRACQGQYCPYPLYASEPDGREAWGSFRTPHALSAGRKGLTFGVSSCWRADLRPFYGIANAPKEDLDFFVSLGDSTYADSAKTGDGPEGTGPDDRARTLSEFRYKNMLSYTARPDVVDANYFAKLRASTAVFATIDDHEVVNNFAGGATPESQKGTCECNATDLRIEEVKSRCEPGGWQVCFCDGSDKPEDWDEKNPGRVWKRNCDREFINETELFKDGLRAWLEYNPVESLNYEADIVDLDEDRPGRIAGKPKLYRYRTFGKDAAIFLLDTRTFRDEPAAVADSNALLPLPLVAFDPRRTMLGSEQLENLLHDLQDARDKGITWKFVLVSVPMQHMGAAAAPDRWEGYAYERAKILDFIQDLKIANVVFVSGDIHGTLANNLIYHKTPTHPNDLSLPFYSSAWDISTGPAAHDEPLIHDVKSEFAMNVNLYAHEYPMVGLEFWNSGATERSPFINYPGPGFIPPVPVVVGFNQVNRFIPETNKKEWGGYSATETNGWTKFEIGTDASRTLTVTTYGIPPGDKREPGSRDIASQFEVAARGLGGNGEHCLLDRDCVSGRCVLVGGGGLARCEAREPNGSPCIGDGECLSGRCSGFTCKAKEPAGSRCLLNRECLSGKCRGLFERTCR